MVLEGCDVQTPRLPKEETLDVKLEKVPKFCYSILNDPQVADMIRRDILVVSPSMRCSQSTSIS